MSAATQIPPAPEVASGPILAAETVEFRQRIGSISRQSGIYFGGTIFTAAAAYFFKIYLARVLGAEALGLYALGMSVVGFLGLFNAVGLPTAASRFVAEYSSQGQHALLGGFLRKGLSLLSAGNLLLGIVVLAVGPWIGAHFYHSPVLGHYFGFFALLMLLGVLNTFLGKCLAGYRQIGRQSIITHFIGTPVNIAIAVILISLGFGLSGYLAAQVASALLVLIILAISVWQFTPVQAWRQSSAGPFQKEVVSFSAVALGIAGVHFVLGQADKVILGIYLHPAQVGVYAVAMGMAGFVPIALQSVNQIFSPMIAELHAGGNLALLKQLYTKLTKWILIFTLPLAFTFIVFAHTLVGLFGRGFQAGASVLAIGAVGQIFNCAVGSVGFLLLMSGNQVKLIRIQAVTAVLMVLLDLILVPRLGITGAAIAAAMAVSMTNLWALAEVSRTLNIFPYDASYLKLALPSALAAAVLLLFHTSTRVQASWKMAAVAMTCSYVAFLGALLASGLDREDRKMAQIAWSKVTGYLGRNGVDVR